MRCEIQWEFYQGGPIDDDTPNEQFSLYCMVFSDKI